MSSKETLERILAKDNIGDLYRAYAVSKRLFLGATLSGFGIGVMYGGIDSMISEFHLGKGIFIGIGAIPAGIGIYNLYNGIKAVKGCFDKANEDNFNYLDGKISHKETGVERVFGRVVYPVDSLSEIEENEKDNAKKCSYKFIDKIILKDLQHNKHDCGYTYYDNQRGHDDHVEIIVHYGEFTLQRGNEERKFKYKYKGGASEFNKLFKAENKEVALIFSNFSKKTEDENYSFVPIKVYDPHP